MAFTGLLDTSVLYPFPLCDILLRLAERELYDPFWSERILEELRRNLLEAGYDESQVDHRLHQMRQTFPSAMVPNAAVQQLEPAMANDEKDRHVLAAAVACSADVVVTFNLRDFPEGACEPYDIDAVHPDAFLLSLYDLDPTAVTTEITAQAAALTQPRISREELIKILARAGVPQFASTLGG
jgi:predicted nucleic acid-binding protein